MKEIKYVIGDATDPRGDGLKYICHVCNDIGVWGLDLRVRCRRGGKGLRIHTDNGMQRESTTILLWGPSSSQLLDTI